MEHDLQGLIEDWDGMVVCRYDALTTSWIFIALHDATRGTPTGGTRMRAYPSPADGLRDAMRLAEGMTHKWAAIDLGFGGGKAVLALSRELGPDERTGLLVRYGRVLAALNGGFGTGVDLGVTPEDMLIVAREAPYVHGCDPERNTTRDPGPYTALGVFSGIGAAVEHVFGSSELSGRRVLVQGLGDVGHPLARMCAEAGGELLLADLDRDLAGRVAGELKGTVVAADDVYTTPCDVYAPCAVGATLNRETIPRLACRIVAGSANNQLAEPQDAGRLHQRGILYAPDYVINAGGALAFGLMAKGETDEEILRSRVVGLGPLLSGIFSEAAKDDDSPLDAAERRVRRVLTR